MFVFTSLLALPSGAADDPLLPLDFLVGTWSGSTAGASGSDIFQRELDGHVLQRHSQSVIRSSAGKPQSTMQALLTVYPKGAGDALAAVYFDNEGHVIQYDHVTVVPGQRVEFKSDGAESSPTFRLTYSLKAGGLLHVKFEMTPPGQSTYRTIAEADETAAHNPRN